MSGFKVALGGVAPEAWTDPSANFDARDYSDVEVQVVGAPSTPYQPQRSLDGVTWINCLVEDEAGNSYAVIAAAGIYAFVSANSYLRLAAGAGAAITRRAAA